MAFYEDVGPAPRGWDLTRHDVQKPHGPGNSVWRPHAEAKYSGRGDSRFVEARGLRLTLAGWARRLRCSHEMLRVRIDKNGWDPVRAVTTPVKRYRRRP